MVALQEVDQAVEALLLKIITQRDINPIQI